jgi:hypothetical protein
MNWSLLRTTWMCYKVYKMGRHGQSLLDHSRTVMGQQDIWLSVLQPRHTIPDATLSGPFFLGQQRLPQWIIQDPGYYNPDEALVSALQDYVWRSDTGIRWYIHSTTILVWGTGHINQNLVWHAPHNLISFKPAQQTQVDELSHDEPSRGLKRMVWADMVGETEQPTMDSSIATHIR